MFALLYPLTSCLSTDPNPLYEAGQTAKKEKKGWGGGCFRISSFMIPIIYGVLKKSLPSLKCLTLQAVFITANSALVTGTEKLSFVFKTLLTTAVTKEDKIN